MKFLYGFGFESPRQRTLNIAHKRDDEDSAAVFIEAETSDAALEWGRAVAESFLKWLYDDPTVSWAAGRYADWIEPDPMAMLTPEQLRGIPTVAHGQMPSLAQISAHSRPEGS